MGLSKSQLKIDVMGKVHFVIDSCSLISQSNTLDHSNHLSCFRNVKILRSLLTPSKKKKNLN